MIKAIVNLEPERLGPTPKRRKPKVKGEPSSEARGHRTAKQIRKPQRIVRPQRCTQYATGL